MRGPRMVSFTGQRACFRCGIPSNNPCRNCWEGADLMSVLSPGHPLWRLGNLRTRSGWVLSCLSVSRPPSVSASDEARMLGPSTWLFVPLLSCREARTAFSHGMTAG